MTAASNNSAIVARLPQQMTDRFQCSVGDVVDVSGSDSGKDAERGLC